MPRILLLLALMLPINAPAAVVREAAFVPPGSIAAWQSSFAAAAKESGDSRHTECREVSSLPGAHLCQFASLASMNEALVRATIFIEGTSFMPKGTLARHGSEDLAFASGRISGHDLTADDLRAFYGRVAEACEAGHDEALCLSPAEDEFFAGFVEPSFAESRPFVVITFGNNFRSATNTAGHEILHAQYFLDPAYRDTVDSYWTDDLSEEGRATVRRMLGLAYDPSNETLMKNEFQAYLLQPEAENAMLGSFVAMMRKPLTLRLRAKGLAPIEIR